MRNNINSARRRSLPVAAARAFDCQSCARGEIVTAGNAVAGTAAGRIPRAGGAVGAVIHRGQINVFRGNLATLLILSVADQDM